MTAALETIVGHRYEVVKEPTWFPFVTVYVVYRVTEHEFEESNQYYVDYQERFRFSSLKKAEAAAAGLAGGSWTDRGPILASFQATEAATHPLVDRYTEEEPTFVGSMYDD